MKNNKNIKEREMVIMKLEVKIDKIIYINKDNNYKVFKGTINGKPELSIDEEQYRNAINRKMTFRGYMDEIKEKDTYIINAKFEISEKYKVVLYVKDYILKKLELESELEAYLINHVEKVGKAKAKKIIEHLGKNAIDIILSNEGIERLSEVVNEKVAKNVRTHIMNNINIFNVMDFLNAIGEDVSIVNKIIDEYGTDKLIDLENNPYLFAKFIKFKTLDAIALKRSKMDSKDPRRVGAGIISYVANKLKQDKDLFADIDDVYEELERYINVNGCYNPIKLEKELIKQCIEELRENAVLTVKKGRFIYLKNIANKESNIAFHLKRLTKADDTYTENEILKALSLFEEAEGKKLSDEQINSVISCFTNKTTIITGLPGSGKTLTVKAINYVARILDEKIKIINSAPTGKASMRMKEMGGENVGTLHRVLNIKSESDKGAKLDTDFIIIDEFSMVDIYLADTLFSNIETGTRVLIVGDIEQLPSIGPGLLLRDMIDSDTIPTTRLTKLFRQAENSNIITNAHAIANKTNDFKFEGDAMIWRVDITQRHIEQTYMALLKKGFSRARMAILSPMRSGELGTVAINRLIQEKFNVGSKEVEIAVGLKIKEKDMVIHTENNYDLGVYNGETGIVEKIKDTQNGITITVKYGEDRFVDYIGDDLKQLDLAYCLTVHKSQGSEYDAVISIIAEEHYMMLDRNLIYTAWTRAKQFLAILGKEETIMDVVNCKEKEIIRKSNLSEMLSGEFYSRNDEIVDYTDYDGVF